MAIEDLFPKLAKTGWQVTSPAASNYNCIAFAAGDEHQWWEPSGDNYWPEDAPQQYSVDALIAAFTTLGFSLCEESTYETGCEKIAIYGDADGYTHAARQLADGKWTSKLGQDVDIVHDTLEVLEGAVYGSVVQVMKRTLPTSE